MQLPAYWWLLALTVVLQGAWFLRYFSRRLRGKELQPLSWRIMALLAVSVASGLAYGVVQSDPLFVLGQLCLLPLYYRMRTSRHE